MDGICQRKISDTISIVPSTLEEFSRTRRKLRKISQVQIALGIGLLLVGILVVVGTGLVLFIAIPSRNDLRILLERVESMEDSLSSLRKDIIENNYSGAMTASQPVSLENYMPSDLMRDILASKKDSGKSTRPKKPLPEKSSVSFSRYLMGRLNQTVSGLDEGNRLMFKRLNRSLIRLKNDFDVRENAMDVKLKENSKQLLKLSNIVSKLVEKLERGDLESQVDTILNMIKVLSKKVSTQALSHPDLLEKIASQANESMIYFGNILSDEMMMIQKHVQGDIIRYVDETKHHYINIDEALNAVIAMDMKIEDETKAIRRDIKSVTTRFDPFTEKIDSLIIGQSRMEQRYDHVTENVESIKSITDEIDLHVTEVMEEQDQLSDAARNVTGMLLGLEVMKETGLVEKLEATSEMLEKLLRQGSSSQNKNLHEFSALLKDELKSALETVASAMSEKSEELSILIKIEIQNVLNEHFEKGFQLMETAMRDESTSQSTADWKEILKEINSQFEKSFKVFEKKLNDQSLSVPTTPVFPNNTLVSKVCTKSEGCTSIEYPTKRCFKVIEAAVDEATWVQAKRKCQLLGGHLAEIHNTYEYDILVKSLPTYGNYWVGGTDRGFEGYWHWDHSLLKITLNNWAPGQPNNHRFVEHCLHLLHDEITVWNDLRCMSKMGYVCEKEGPNCEVWT